MRTDRTQDQSGNYSALDVVLVKSPGFKAWWKRLITRCQWDDIAVILQWDKDLHVCQVIEGRLMYGPNLQKWGGLITSRRLKTKLINFRSNLRTEDKARSYVGQRFVNTANCIGHIFDIAGVKSIKQLINV